MKWLDRLQARCGQEFVFFAGIIALAVALTIALGLWDLSGR